MATPELESLLQELEAISLALPNTCGCCPPGGIANHDCNWSFKSFTLGTMQKVYRDPAFIGNSAGSCCDHVREYIEAAKKRALASP